MAGIRSQILKVVMRPCSILILSDHPFMLSTLTVYDFVGVLLTFPPMEKEG